MTKNQPVTADDGLTLVQRRIGKYTRDMNGHVAPSQPDGVCRCQKCNSARVILDELFYMQMVERQSHSALQSDSRPLVEFARWAIREGSWDGYDAQEKAAELGLIIKTKYAPDEHGESDFCEPGDDWYVFGPLLAEQPAALKSETSAMALLRGLNTLVDFEMGWETCACFPNASDVDELCKRIGAFIADQRDET